MGHRIFIGKLCRHFHVGFQKPWRPREEEVEMALELFCCCLLYIHFFVTPSPIISPSTTCLNICQAQKQETCSVFMSRFRFYSRHLDIFSTSLHHTWLDPKPTKDQRLHRPKGLQNRLGEWNCNSKSSMMMTHKANHQAWRTPYWQLESNKHPHEGIYIPPLLLHSSSSSNLLAFWPLMTLETGKRLQEGTWLSWRRGVAMWNRNLSQRLSKVCVVPTNFLLLGKSGCSQGTLCAF